MRKADEICKAMGITRLRYENCRENFYMKWCSAHADARALPLRTLLRSEALHTWFCDQWSRRVELPFYQDHQEYLEAGLQDYGHLQDLFLIYAEEIDNYYPKPLLETLASNYKSRLTL